MATETPHTVELDPTPDGSRTLRLPADATPLEAAAVAACIGAYLNGEVVAGDEDAEQVSGWLLAGRLGCRRPSEAPRRVERGSEWKMAGRADRLR
jgi:hypothetical protein